jgi:hypothetical protein
VKLPDEKQIPGVRGKKIRGFEGTLTLLTT